MVGTANGNEPTVPVFLFPDFPYSGAVFMSDQFIVRHPIAKNDGTTIEPRSKPYSLSDFKGVNLEFLMSVKSVVPVGGSVPRNLLVDVENASKEELLEENRRLQAALEGCPNARPAAPPPATI